MVLESPTNEQQLIDQFLEILQGLPDVHANLSRWESFGSADLLGMTPRSSFMWLVGRLGELYLPEGIRLRPTV